MGYINQKGQDPLIVPNPDEGKFAWAVDTNGNPYVKDSSGQITYLGVTGYNILADKGVGLDQETPTENLYNGAIYVTSDTLKKKAYNAEAATWDETDLDNRNTVLDSANNLLFSYDGNQLIQITDTILADYWDVEANIPSSGLTIGEIFVSTDTLKWFVADSTTTFLTGRAIPFKAFVLNKNTDTAYLKGASALLRTSPVAGAGDMTKAVYDPTNVNGDAFDRANHTGTQTASTISDFDTEVSNNTDVAANTAKVGVTTEISNVVEDTTPQLGGTLDTNSKTIKYSQGANLASATSLNPANDGNSFLVTGTTTINDILSTNWSAGNTIRLIFAGVLTITHNGTVAGDDKPIILVKAANYTTAVGDVLELYYDGTDWKETNNLTKEGGGGGSLAIQENGGTQYTEALLEIITNNTSVLTNDSGVKNVLTLLLSAMKDFDTTGISAGDIIQRNAVSDGFEAGVTKPWQNSYHGTPVVVDSTSDNIGYLLLAGYQFDTITIVGDASLAGTLSIGTASAGAQIVNAAALSASMDSKLTIVANAEYQSRSDDKDIYVSGITAGTATLYFTIKKV